MLCNQFRHTTSQDLEVLYTAQIFIDIIQTNAPSCPFLASDDGSKRRSRQYISEYHREY